ncbi:MAG: hypothetical protein P8080_10160 [Gammaproteobacteria bacterium]
MQPLTVVTGILLGTAASITAGLSVVLLIYFLLAGEHPRLEAEFRPLIASTAIFTAMTIICATSFIGLIRQSRWRWLSQAIMWSGVVLTVFYYLPEN